MRAEIKLDCCGFNIKTSSSECNFIDCYLLKQGEKPFKKKLADKRTIKKELLFVAYCPRCGHWILKFCWYASKDARPEQWDETKIVRGKKGDEIFDKRMDMYILKNIPRVFLPKIIKTSQVPYGWTYGINKELHKNGEVVGIRQYRSDFQGQKEIIKELDLTTNIEKPIQYVYEKLKDEEE